MGQDCGSSLPSQHLSPVFPRLNHLIALPHSRGQDLNFLRQNCALNMVSVCGASPVQAQLSQSHVVGEDESVGGVCGFSNLHPPLASPQKPCMKQTSRANLFGNQIEDVVPKAGTECGQRRFLVFDQSGDQTTLIFSAGIRKPLDRLTSGSLEPRGSLDMKKDLLRTKEDLGVLQGMLPREESDENDGPDVQSEMHEDTEELNALLYSDDESDCSDEDEVTSSGHSPSTMPDHCNQEASVGSTEGISAFAGHKHATTGTLLDGPVCDVETPTTPLNTLNSMKRKRSCSMDENDAESSCGNGGSTGSAEYFLSSSNKKIKREKICETVSLLRSIVPGVNAEDPVFVIDRAIDYLKSLKMKAKDLGLDSLRRF